MFDFLEVFGDVIKVVTFQQKHQTGRKLPTRQKHADWPGAAYDWSEPIRRGRR